MTFFTPLIKPFKHEKGLFTLLPESSLKESSKILARDYLAAWSAPGFFGYIVLDYLTNLTGDQQFRAAGLAAASVTLWNMLVIAGVSLALIGNLFMLKYTAPINTALKHTSHRILKFASEGGAIAFGVLCAMFLASFFYTKEDILYILPETLFGISLLSLLLVINACVWWATHCLNLGKKAPLFFRYMRRNYLATATYSILVLSILALATWLNYQEKLPECI